MFQSSDLGWIIPTVLAVGGIIWRLSAIAASQRAAIGALRAEMDKKLADLRTDFTEYKVEVAEKYVSAKSMRELEDRLIDSINRLGDRLDRVLEKQS